MRDWIAKLTLKLLGHIACESLRARIKELEAENAQLKNWEQEKQRYQLHELAVGTLVYRIKPDMQNGEPEHDICQLCYEEAIKSILQLQGIDGRRDIFQCPRCKARFLGPARPPRQPQKAHGTDYNLFGE